MLHNVVLNEQKDNFFLKSFKQTLFDVIDTVLINHLPEDQIKPMTAHKSKCQPVSSSHLILSLILLDCLALSLSAFLTLISVGLEPGSWSKVKPCLMSLQSLSEQVSLSTGTKKLFAATAFGAVSLILIARRFRRRKGKRKANSPVEQETFEFLTTIHLSKGKNEFLPSNVEVLYNVIYCILTGKK